VIIIIQYSGIEMLSSEKNRHSAPDGVTKWRRSELASAIASAARQMDRMDGLELPESEYEKLEADLLARPTLLARDD
jgi:hypothetical protein